MVDRFASSADSVSDQGRRHVQIVPDDNADRPELPKAIYCQASGTIAIKDEVGVVLPYTMTAGQILPFRGTRILATGTTGTFYGWF